MNSTRKVKTAMLSFSCAGFLMSLLLTGCAVEQKCYNDADCAEPLVCLPQEGECVTKECFTCAFPHAEALCIDGRCEMGACEDGYHDLNSDEEDGCEYFCEISNGGVEDCDEIDNDCDGAIDEDFDLKTDTDNCGECGNICPDRQNSNPVCKAGKCGFICIEGWYDANGLPEDGCETRECIPTDEVCDGTDNDCDCPGDTNGDEIWCGPGDEGVDEGFDKTLPESCGPYCEVCEYDNAIPLCTEGECEMGDCLQDWYDANENPLDGCECEYTNGGEEICDDIDNDCDGKTDEGGVCGFECPLDMVSVDDQFCIDIYEASRQDATETSQGTDNSIATSRPEVMPWIVNPMTYSHFVTFQSACEAAGKHLCTKEEWYAACAGPAPENNYVFGNVFDPETCNCVDTFCNDYCQENGISPGECSTGANCGYDYYCFHAVPTGTFPDCTNEYETYDICGNAWEIVPSDTDSRGYEVRGGAFNCASAATRLQCTYNAGWTALYAGFRCCKTP